MILMLLWARMESTKYIAYMVRVPAYGAEHCFVSFGGDTVSTWMFGMEEPSAFHTVYKSFDLVSVLYAGKAPPINSHHAEDAYMALYRVVAWATRWRESAGNPFCLTEYKQRMKGRP